MSTSTSSDQWAYFFAIERPLLGSALYLPVRGNHDTSGSNFLNFFAPPPSSPLPERYCAVRYNSTLFVGLATEPTSNFNSTQTAWLETTLQQAIADPTILWKVAFFHVPLFSSGWHGGDEGIPISTTWHPLVVQYGVDAVFNGHDHGLSPNPTRHVNARWLPTGAPRARC